MAEHPSPQQLSIVFNDIALSASAITQLAIVLGQSNDPETRSALHAAVGALADRIGLIADRADVSLCGAGPLKGTSPEDWLMSPAWHDEEAKRKADAADGQRGAA